METQHRRTVDNFVKNSKLRRKYYLYVFLGGLLSSTLFGTLMLLHLKDIQAAVASAGMNATSIVSVYDKLFLTALLFFASSIAYTIFATIIVVYLEGRVGGSALAIVEVIEQYHAGNYSHSRELRKGDELQPVMDALKSLGDKLKS